jgi:hypothetical protein
MLSSWSLVVHFLQAVVGWNGGVGDNGDSKDGELCDGVGGGDEEVCEEVCGGSDGEVCCG